MEEILQDAAFSSFETIALAELRVVVHIWEEGKSTYVASYNLTLYGSTGSSQATWNIWRISSANPILAPLLAAT